MRAVQKLHPVVSLIWFAAVIGGAMFLTHPVCLALSLCCAAATAVMLNGKRVIRFALTVALPMFFLVVLINPLVNHRGVTVLGYLPWNNPLTLESILFGAASAVMLMCVMLWFSAFHTVMTSDKLVFLFGKALPSLGLVLAMALRFVPRFASELRSVRQAHESLYPRESGFLPRLKGSVRVLSVMISAALENSVETADSMKARGYGLKGRTAYSRYRMTACDGVLLGAILLLTALLVTLAFCGAARFRYFPAISSISPNAGDIAFFVTYAALLIMPLIMCAEEEWRWRQYISKI